MNGTEDAYDFIVVGAGSSGSVIANKLSADPACKVLLVEAGGSARHPFVTMPKGFSKIVRDARFAWHFPVEQPRLPGLPTQEVWLRGKGLGGSSSVNGMIYIRGQPEDYDDWAAHADAAWGWPEMKRVFCRMEDHQLGSGPDRGTGGPLHVDRGRVQYPLSDAMIAAGQEFGLPYKEDLNEIPQEGIGYYPHTIRRGRRFSAANAFLDPIRNRKNLRILTDTLVDRVTFESFRASGVVAQTPQGVQRFACRREVILCAGTIQSPVILQRSGIGPGEVLHAAEVPVLVDSPDVGNRMREHVGFSMAYALFGDRGINGRLRKLGLMLSGLQYYARRRGVLATGPFEVGAFVRAHPHADRPDVQLYLGGFTYARNDDNSPVASAQVERAPGFTIYGQMLRPTSEGSIAIRSSDPAQSPRITPNWLSTGEDQETAVAMVRTMRRFVEQPSLNRYRGEELLPGARFETDEEILDVVRRTSTSGLHGVATCRMGNDNLSVVDQQLRVRGVTGLRVVDCSVMPTPVSGNTNGPAMALAWRASEVMGVG